MTNIRVDDYKRTLGLSFTFTHWLTLTYRPQSMSRNRLFTEGLGKDLRSGARAVQEPTSTDLAPEAPKHRYVSVEKAKKDLTDYRAALMYLQTDMTIKFFSVVEGHDNDNTHIHVLAYNWNGTIDHLRRTWPHGHSLIERIAPEENEELIAYMMKDCSKYDTDHHTFKYLGREWSDPIEKVV